MSETLYCVVLFNSTTHAVRAEKICRKANIDVRLLPVPRRISSDCGVCLRFFAPDKPRITELLDESKAEYISIVELD